MSSQSYINDQLPLTEATFFILLSLAPGARHGYAIIKNVTALSCDRVNLSTGTLYGAIKRMLEQQWIVPSDLADPGTAGRPRKAYALTDLGRRVLQAETDRLQELASVGQQTLRGTSG